MNTEQLGFVGAVRKFFRGYADFRGKSSRSEWWLVALFLVLLQLLPFSIFVLGVFLESDFLGQLGLVFLSLAWLGLVVPIMALYARRLRDAGFSPYLLFLLLVPLGGIAILIMMWFFPSKPAV
jgi:uncharacterized membrane protein YhaH (DUF805 family)